MAAVALLLLMAILLDAACDVTAQEPVIDTRLGSLTGVPFYSSRRSLVYGFLGIPYAKPPVGNLRFRPPERHPGWNRTLAATRYGQACPQPGSYQASSSEDCLTLNIWIPEYPVGFRPIPVVVFLEGELFTFGYPARFPAEDLVAEGVIVVSVNYRLNVLGFFCLENALSPGNLGLLDQYLALRWVRDNIDRFGGDINRVTLMGHSAGAASAALHMLSPRTQGLFQQVILMSGSALSPWAISRRPRSAALGFARDLNCLFEDTEALLDCLRSRDLDAMMRALDKSYRVGNSTELFLPVIDSFLPEGFQYMPLPPELALTRGDYVRIPVLSGVSSHDGVLFLYQNPELLHASAPVIKRYFENGAIPQAMTQAGLDANWFTNMEILKFVFVEETNDGRHTLLEQLIDFYTEAHFVAPQARFLQLASQGGAASLTYAYALGYPGPDIYGSVINVTGAPHGTILLYLLGPSVYRFQVGRDFTPREREISDRIKRQWVNFVQNGDPTPSTYGVRWAPYGVGDQYYYLIEEDRLQRGYLPYRSNFWNNFLPRINNLGAFSPQPDGPGYPGYNGYPATTAYVREASTEPFRSLFFVLLAAVLLLLVCLGLTWVCLRKRRKAGTDL